MVVGTPYFSDGVGGIGITRRNAADDGSKILFATRAIGSRSFFACAHHYRSTPRHVSLSARRPSAKRIIRVRRTAAAGTCVFDRRSTYRGHITCLTQTSIVVDGDRVAIYWSIARKQKYENNPRAWLSAKNNKRSNYSNVYPADISIFHSSLVSITDIHILIYIRYLQRISFRPRRFAMFQKKTGDRVKTTRSHDDF